MGDVTAHGATTNARIVSVSSAPMQKEKEPEEPTMCFCNTPYLITLPPLPSDLRRLCCAETAVSELRPLPDGLEFMDVTGCPIGTLRNLPTGLRTLRTRTDLTRLFGFAI
jgi:hypothetical protein